MDSVGLHVRFPIILSDVSSQQISCMIISKKVEFSASHICRSPELSDAENERVYGAAANPLGHGHNYVVEVAIAGEPDPVTGMILDLKRLKEILEEARSGYLRSPPAEPRS